MLALLCTAKCLLPRRGHLMAMLEYTTYPNLLPVVGETGRAREVGTPCAFLSDLVECI